MKRLISIVLSCIAILAISCSGSAQQNPQGDNSLAELNLKGAVESTSEVIYFGALSGSEVVKGKLLRNDVRRTFDRQGRLVKEDRPIYYEDEVELGRYIETYTYDEHGNMIEKTLTSDDGDLGFNKFTETVTTSYDDKGNPLKETKTLARESGKEVSITTFSYQYDLQGKITARTTESQGRKEVETFKYDSQGLCILISSGNTLQKFEYDAKGNKTSWISCGIDGDSEYEMAKRNYKYDSSGRLVETTEYEGGDILIYRHIDKLNDKGDPVEYDDFSKYGDSFDEHVYLKYKYDSQGNWTEKSGWFMDSGKKSPRSVTIRTITYYPTEE